MNDAEALKAVPVPAYGKYAAMLARIYMLPHVYAAAAQSEQAMATIQSEQLRLYARVEEGLGDALAGRGIAREVASDFAIKFCSRILEDIRAIEAEGVP